MDGFCAFGKIPALGDFFRIGTTRRFAQVWDGWLQTLLLDSRAVLGDRWIDCYMSAPIWRFQLSAGVAGPSVVSGVLMPSVDRVGRQFPLTLMAAQDRLTPAVLEQLEDIALAALSDEMTRERLAASLAHLPIEIGTDATKNGWTAVVEGQTLSIPIDGLPVGPEGAKMFDLTGWRTFNNSQEEMRV